MHRGSSLEPKFLRTQYFFRHKIFRDPKCFCSKILLDPNLFWIQKFFEPIFSCTRNFFGPKFFWTKNLFGPEFFFSKILGHNIFLDQTYFFTPNFLFNQKLVRPPNYFGPIQFLVHKWRGIKPFKTEHFRLQFCEIHKPSWQIKTMLVNESKQGSNQGHNSLSLHWAWHGSACLKIWLYTRLNQV